MDRSRLLIGAAALVSIGVVALVAAVAPSPSASRTPASPAFGGDGYAPYPDGPRRLTEGTFTNLIRGPGKVEGAQDRGQREAALEDSRPKFSGWYEGIYIHGEYGRPRDPSVPDACDGPARVATVEELRESPLALAYPGYLPPGTFETAPQHGVMCDGRVASVAMSLSFGDYGGSLSIHRRLGALVSFRASAPRLDRDTHDGRTSVLIRPLTSEGYLHSAVIIPDEQGWYTSFVASDVPFDVLLQIARSLS